MSDGLIERMQESTYDPETREILDLGAFAHLAVADVCMARLRLEQAAAALVAKDAEIARLREGLSIALDWNWLDDDAPEEMREYLEGLICTEDKGETP